MLLAVLGLPCFARALSSCFEQGLLCCSAWPSYWGGFSLQAQALGTWAAGVAAQWLGGCSLWALELKHHSCGTQA